MPEQTTEKTPAQIAFEKKTAKLAQWADAAERHRDRGVPSQKRLSYLYDLLRKDGVNDHFQKEVYTAMLRGGSVKQVDYFIDVLKGKTTWTPRSRPAPQPVAGSSDEPVEELEPAMTEVGAKGDDFVSPFDGDDPNADKMPW